MFKSKLLSAGAMLALGAGLAVAMNAPAFSAERTVLIAEIRRKLLDLETLAPDELTPQRIKDLLRETKEDLLTADVFGALKYLPRDPYLSSVLQELAVSSLQQI